MKFSDGAARAALAGILEMVAPMSAVALIVLWLTGIALVYAIYGGWSGLCALFRADVAAVAGLTGTSATAQVLMMRTRRGNGPPPAAILPKLGRAGMVFALASVVLAMLAFTY